MSASKIQWTDSTWNPVTGCSKKSAGCQNCYAEPMAKRLKVLHPKWYSNGFEPTCHEARLYEPFTLKPQRVFVCSMSDLFHEEVPDDFIVQVFATMLACPDHTFQVLTKRAERMAEFAATITWPTNVWAGVTVERDDYVHRADVLRTVEAPVRFISAEPLLGPLPSLNLEGIDQLIVGGEAGPKWRTMDPEWARDLRDRAVADRVAFFFKQYSALHPKKLGHELDGREWREMPSHDAVTVDER